MSRYLDSLIIIGSCTKTKDFLWAVSHLWKVMTKFVEFVWINGSLIIFESW